MSTPQFPRIPLVRSLAPQQTQDGSFTFFSQEFGELFHSHHGAKQEAEQKFVHPTRLREQAHIHDVLYLLDVCYGLGYNSAAAIDAIWDANPRCRIVLVGLELDRVVPKAAVHEDLLDCWSNDVQWRLADLAQEHQFEDARLSANLYFGDARSQIQDLCESGFQANGIFLDPFSPPTCPELWTVDFLKKLGECLGPKGYLATYSCSAAIRSALQEIGLQIGSTHPVGRKSPGTVAIWGDHPLPPLSLQEQEHLQTRAAIPYRDPRLSDSRDLIQERRRQEQAESNLEPTSHWKKRWAAVN
ncbi:tRNA (5-methylaminomethyl-2-thiouridine)(34)-methyltransferase MnmD [Sodalinema gerasimenkoae]|uniref:tRNA (5-methylaminomethyl-2-thiouridine)(34)-methyltransferase MnmD n=1 Tax=Sodalinema gerasimenkoae TaxID=2862348 RepID=UPI00135CE9FE|nr:MnmC family methyltransferase [Sodalinema gerasimenkoae]